MMSVSELLKLGDFGLGTLDHLDGEMIVLDGKVYQIRGDGAVLDVGFDRSTPFGVVKRFKADGEFACPAVDNLTAKKLWLSRSVSRTTSSRFVSMGGSLH